MRYLVTLLCGALFGAGLMVSGMVDPAKVIGFFDVTGNWDPSLALVMAGALMVYIPSFLWVKRRQRPLLEESLNLPANSNIDKRLLIGSAIFGAGWGIAGICPGAAVAAIAAGSWQIALFIAAMLAGLYIGSHWQSYRLAKKAQALAVN